MRRTVQEFFPGVGKFRLRRQATSGFKYFQTFNRPLQMKSWLLIWEVVTVTVIVLVRCGVLLAFVFQAEGEVRWVGG